MICLGPEFYLQMNLFIYLFILVLQMNLVVFFILSSSVNRAKSQTSIVFFNSKTYTV